MNTLGIIAEYNPFHNGHLYHLTKVKEMFPDHLIILVLAGNFTQRGSFSIINKYDKTKIALNYGVDLVIELPYNFTLQSADEFANGGIQILNSLNVDKIIFGSETDDITLLKKIAKFNLNELVDNNSIKESLKNGNNYPTALSNATKKTFGYNLDKSNDILGVCYIKEIIKNNYNITPYSIKRTNDYNDLISDADIISASNIREKLKNNSNIDKYIPNDVHKYINWDFDYDFKLLKYNIINNLNNLDTFLLIDKPMANLIKKHIYDSFNKEELISKIKNKNYTYGRISRALCNIVCNYKKSDKYSNIKYLNILGSNKKGLKYLNSIKKNVKLNIVTKFTDFDQEAQELEKKLDYIYNYNKNTNKSLKNNKIIIL